MATKFVSALTGPEMDQALTDMAYHNSEAYAVGTRNGVEVGSSDVTYHNNAKYYASQTGADAQSAEAAAARAEAAVPSGTAGAVFFDRAQSLTTAQQSQARANIMAGGTNPNLLDNWYFVGGGSQLGDGIFPINQRGQTSYSAYTNSIDRWYAAAAMTIAADGLSCGVIVQKLPQVANLNGKTLTFSALKADGTMLYGSAVLNSASDTYFYSASGEFLLYSTYFGGFEVVTADKIAAVKLEYGTVSTLANDVPPDFGEELRKCQRYLWFKTFSGNTQIGSGVALTADQAIVSVVTPASMRPAQNITLTANVLLVGNGQVATASAVTGINQYDNIARLTLSSSGLTAYHTYSFFTTTETTMAIYAEL